MTNEQAKQEAIKKAYGEKWDLVKKLTPKNGNDDYDLIFNGFFKLKFLKLNMGSHLDFFPIDKFHYQDVYVIPLSIQGLHDNNGWIRIEPDGSNLPEKGSETKSYKIGKLENGIFDIFSYDVQTDWLAVHAKSGNITHYKPIEPELKTIY